MSTLLRFKNRCRGTWVRLPLLKQVTRKALGLAAPDCDHDLQVSIVEDDEMAALNQSIVNHAGTTDVITLDYVPEPGERLLAGELFICMDEAKRQATVYHVPWEQELTRYVIHGILHLTGFDDVTAALRAKMKLEEEKLLGLIGSQFELGRLSIPNGRKAARKRKASPRRLKAK